MKYKQIEEHKIEKNGVVLFLDLPNEVVMKFVVDKGRNTEEEEKE